jgi:hypothetical protein
VCSSDLALGSAAPVQDRLDQVPCHCRCNLDRDEYRRVVPADAYGAGVTEEDWFMDRNNSFF